MSLSVFPTTYMYSSCSTEPNSSRSFLSLLFRLSRLATETVMPKFKTTDLNRIGQVPWIARKQTREQTVHALVQVVGGSKFVKHEAVDMGLCLFLPPSPTTATVHRSMTASEDMLRFLDEGGVLFKFFQSDIFKSLSGASGPVSQLQDLVLTRCSDPPENITFSRDRVRITNSSRSMANTMLTKYRRDVI